MASEIKMKITGEGLEVTVTMQDPIGTNNTWSASPAAILGADQGAWNQVLGAADLYLSGGNPSGTILVLQGINTHASNAELMGMSGEGIHLGSGGKMSENAAVDALVIDVS